MDTGSARHRGYLLGLLAGVTLDGRVAVVNLEETLG
jgi:hypothetical protein